MKSAVCRVEVPSFNWIANLRQVPAQDVLVCQPYV